MNFYGNDYTTIGADDNGGIYYRVNNTCSREKIFGLSTYNVIYEKNGYSKCTEQQFYRYGEPITEEEYRKVSREVDEKNKEWKRECYKVEEYNNRPWYKKIFG